MTSRRPAPPKRRRAPARRRTRSLRRRAERHLLLIALIAVLAVAAGWFAARHPAWIAARPPKRPPMSMAEARIANAKVPIARARRRIAAPYRFRGGPAAREQASECLATAAMYEVGDDRRGQRAVIQVVLNRVRAPGYPKTVCGVVYQGWQRPTGCQFSFTCDGSFSRRRIRTGWGAARRAAKRALGGYVFADVGRATHYHADWMVPYWRDSLTKVAKVGPHLFYQR